MKIYLFNDTKDGHSGSKETMVNLNNILSEHEVINRHNCGEFDYSLKDLKKADAVVVNGEGSIHHNNDKSKFLMSVLGTAQRFDRMTYLINTTYQDMPDEYDKILERMTYLQVREYASYQYIIRKTIPCEIKADLSVNQLIPRKGQSYGKKMCVGEAHPDVKDAVDRINNISGYPVNLNDRSFQSTISFYTTTQRHM